MFKRFSAMLILFLFLAFTGCNQQKATPVAAIAERIRPRVLNGNSLEPIENARVVLAETGQSFMTDRQGYTKEILLPQAPQDALPNRNWAQGTILVYAKGYRDTLIFGVQGRGERMRNGPDILLFPPSPTAEVPYILLAEQPPIDWVNALLQKYRASE